MKKSTRNFMVLGGIALFFIGFCVGIFATMVPLAEVAIWVDRTGRMLWATGIMVVGLAYTLAPRDMPSLSIPSVILPPILVFLAGCGFILLSSFLVCSLAREILASL